VFGALDTAGDRTALLREFSYRRSGATMRAHDKRYGRVRQGLRWNGAFSYKQSRKNTYKTREKVSGFAREVREGKED
jgi:hypothetical protein